MEIKYSLLSILFIVIGCSNERIRILNQAEDVMPGNWHIESVRLPRYGQGVTYQGNTFMSDTILFDIGTFEIEPFSADSLKPGLPAKVKCNLIIDNEDFPFSINTLVASGEDIFTFIGFNGPEGTFPITTLAEKFIWSSYIFMDNYFIKIIDEDHIELQRANQRSEHVITLKRQ